MKANGMNIYDMNRVENIRLMEQEKSNRIYEDALHNPESNRMIEGPPENYFRKVDGENQLPMLFKEPKERDKYTKWPTHHKKYGAGHPVGKPLHDGHYGISLTGEPIDPQHFTHNNMQPFFGSKIRQNVDEYATNNIIENFTGQESYKRKKYEVPQLFHPEANIHNPYGMSSLSGFQRERMVTSNIRNNEAPTEKIYVAPGINKGYTWQGTGGFQQADMRDYILPKNVDELRVKTNPKMSYYLPIVPGKKISRRVLIGRVEKKKPDSFAIWGPKRWFVTTGERLKQRHKPEVVLRHTNRTTTDFRQTIGVAGPALIEKEGVRPYIKTSTKCQYGDGGYRNVDATGKWSILKKKKYPKEYFAEKKECFFNKSTQPENKVDPRNDSCYNTPDDYGRNAILTKANNRDTTKYINPFNVKGVSEQSYIPITQPLRYTRKQDFLGNRTGNLKGYEKPRVWNPLDKARTTTKETTLSEGRIGIVGRNMFMKHKHRIPDKAKKTLKETIEISHVGNPNFSCQPMNRANIKNMTTHTQREVLSKGRTPGGCGAKETPNVGFVNTSLKKVGSVLNKVFMDRPAMVTKVYDQNKRWDRCVNTRTKMIASNNKINNRLDISLLQPYKNNPYTQSLLSCA